jgi:hypothetical protein
MRRNLATMPSSKKCLKAGDICEFLEWNELVETLADCDESELSDTRKQ